MKPSESSGIFKPFKNLKALLERKAVALKPAPSLDSNRSDEGVTDRRQEQAMFKQAMTDVKKISRANCAKEIPAGHVPPGPEQRVEYDPLVQLKNLVAYGTGFVVCQTPEYIEGTGYGVNPDVARRLHRGDFSIQAHIDLHGLSVNDAHEAFDQFLNESIGSGKRAVLIIHGRGLSSPARPILKTKVYQWLTSSPWHKWVMAFTSARLCDGGAGATYVLLRQRPMTKRFRKKKKGSNPAER